MENFELLDDNLEVESLEISTLAEDELRNLSFWLLVIVLACFLFAGARYFSYRVLSYNLLSSDSDIINNQISQVLLRQYLVSIFLLAIPSMVIVFALSSFRKALSKRAGNSMVIFWRAMCFLLIYPLLMFLISFISNILIYYI